MAYFVLEDFSAGIDRRKSAVTARAGSLRVLRNAFVNAGGEIEKRKAFATHIPAGDTAPGLAFGLAGLSGALYTFGTGTRPSRLDPRISYQRLNGASAIARIRDADIFDGKLYAVSEPTTGPLQHFFDGTLATGHPASSIVRTYKRRMWGVSGDTLFYSQLNNPGNWTPGAGGGSISLDTQDFGALTLRGIEAYYDRLAVFGRSGVQMWSIDENPALNQTLQTLSGLGLVGERAYARVGDGDVLFLSDSGVRSLRARDSSNVASVSDTGSPVDEILRARLAAAGADVTGPGFLPEAMTCIEPETGQFWLAWGTTIYVLSMTPSARVVAWSVFETPAPVEYLTTAGGRVYARWADNVLLYGGAGNAGYDQSETEVVTPLMSMNEPATDKRFIGLDIACEGVWTVDVATDPMNPDVFEFAGTVMGPTFGMQKMGIQHSGTHISLRLRSQTAARARLGQIIVHFQAGNSG